MIKLNWAKGQNLGLSLIYIGILGFVQVVFISIAQYSMKIGSIYAVQFMPLGAIFATFYSVVILFESQTSMKQYRTKYRHRTKKRKTKNINDFVKSVINFFKKPKIKPVISVIISFTAFFLIGYGASYSFVEDASSVFVIAENAGSIGTLFYATYIETKMNRRTRR